MPADLSILRRAAQDAENVSLKASWEASGRIAQELPMESAHHGLHHQKKTGNRMNGPKLLL